MKIGTYVTKTLFLIESTNLLNNLDLISDIIRGKV